MPLLASPCSRATERRHGVVLLAVLVVLVLLSLAAYNYSELMVSEYSASVNFHKEAQTRAYADSGIHYAMAMLATSNNIATLLNNNPFDNAEVFRNQAVGTGSQAGFFTLIAPLNPNNTGTASICQFGVVDESSKININAMMAADATGKKLYTMLMLLPNMTDDIASSIVNWVNTDPTPYQGNGAESDYYNSLSPPYNCKNGPLSSLDELLLVRGVTPQFLYGGDFNRNGYQDMGEVDTGNGLTNGFDLGWAHCLTIYSREQNVNASGAALTNLNDTTVDLETMYGSLSSVLGDDLAKFIIMYRQNGASSSTSATTGSAGGGATTPTPAAAITYGKLSSYALDTTKAGSNTIKSLYDLVTAQVQITVPPPANSRAKATTVTYKSPLSDPTQQAELLPLLFLNTTIFSAAEIPARVNVNTAPLEVLTALPGLATADVQAIMAVQPQYTSADPPGDIYQTPAWLITQAKISPTKLSKLEPYITARSQVYRVQSLGYGDQAKGPVVRIEAVLDTNGGQPRILYWRDMSDLGRIRPPQ